MGPTALFICIFDLERRGLAFEVPGLLVHLLSIETLDQKPTNASETYHQDVPVKKRRGGSEFPIYLGKHGRAGHSGATSVALPGSSGSDASEPS